LRGCDKFYWRGLDKNGGINLEANSKTSETCINGLLLSLLAYFRHPDPRIEGVFTYLLNEQMPDGGWNCRRQRGATHASFNTTILVLEGFFEYSQTYPQQRETLRPVLAAAHEFLLRHRIYKSHLTGRLAIPTISRMTFPPRWHYDFLRGLDYCQSIQLPHDPRMQDAIDLLRSKQTADGRWVLITPWKGREFFQMEVTGQPSRWNTLRALRVLKWWGEN
jgi:hypothetical protein